MNSQFRFLNWLQLLLQHHRPFMKRKRGEVSIAEGSLAVWRPARCAIELKVAYGAALCSASDRFQISV
jgi:hypothetical protein